MTLPAPQSIDPRLAERSVRIRWTRVEYAEGGHRRTDLVLAWTPLDNEHAIISAWEDDRAGAIRTIMAPREMRWTGVWRGSALHLDAFERGERMLGLSIEWSSEEDALDLLYVRCTPLSRYGFTPRHCCPPIPELAVQDVVTGVDATRCIA